MKEFLFRKRKLAGRFLQLRLRRAARLFCDTRLSRDRSFEVPIVINNRNRLEWLQQLVSWLKNAGYRTIVVLDNDSDYEPLLNYYRTGAVQVVHLGFNGGYKALWSSDLFKKIRSHYYVYTDPDVLPGAECPGDVVYRLYEVLSRYGEIEKCGVALRIDDLPDHYARKREVIDKIESRYWLKEVEKNIYDAPVDTTFALYRPFAKGNAEECPAFRLAGDCTWRHMPWYEDSADLGKESKHYISRADRSTTWYKPE